MKKENIKRIINLLIFCACLFFLLIQLRQCLNKYTMGDNIVTSISSTKLGSQGTRPALTFCGWMLRCPSMACTSIDGYRDTWDWDWWKYENPWEEFEKGTYDIEDMASEVTYEIDGKEVSVMKNDSEWETIWKTTFPEKFYGKCFTFVAPPHVDKVTFHIPIGGSMTEIRLPDLKLIFHSENKTMNQDLRKELIWDKLGDVDIFVKVDILKNMNTKQMPCENQNYDEEYTKFLIQKMLSVAGCVVPWVKRNETLQICMDEANATIAENVYQDIKKKNLIDNEDAPAPCEYLETSLEVLKTEINSEGDYKKLHVHLRPVAKMIEQVDGYTFLSFLAEVGGYLGLFLGMSIYHLADFISYCMDHMNSAKKYVQ